MAAISAIFEITKINPSIFVQIIPQTYQLLCSTTNNWVLIKIIKLITEFVEVEPRLGPKLRPKFKEMMDGQKAKSVQFEIVK